MTSVKPYEKINIKAKPFAKLALSAIPACQVPIWRILSQAKRGAALAMTFYPDHFANGCRLIGVLLAAYVVLFLMLVLLFHFFGLLM